MPTHIARFSPPLELGSPTLTKFSTPKAKRVILVAQTNISPTYALKKVTEEVEEAKEAEDEVVKAEDEVEQMHQPSRLVHQDRIQTRSVRFVKTRDAGASASLAHPHQLQPEHPVLL